MKTFQEYLEGRDPCWKGYKQQGMKKKGDKDVPNCVPVKESAEHKKHKGEDVTLHITHHHGKHKKKHEVASRVGGVWYGYGGGIIGGGFANACNGVVSGHADSCPGGGPGPSGGGGGAPGGDGGAGGGV